MFVNGLITALTTSVIMLMVDGVAQQGGYNYSPNNNQNQYNNNNNNRFGSQQSQQNRFQNVNQQGAYQQQQQQQPQQQPQQNRNFVPITSYQNEINYDGSYQYSYTSGDGSQQQARGSIKNLGQKDLEAQTVQGSYSYVSPDGTPITVNYVADENGFRADGAHLPTPPPIPEAIAKSLQYHLNRPSSTNNNNNQGNYNQQQQQQQQQQQYNNNNQYGGGQTQQLNQRPSGSGGYNSGRRY